MIVYFADRNLNILGQASTTLIEGLRIANDSKTESIDSGTKTFEFDVYYDKANRAAVQDIVALNGYILRHNEEEDEFYSIVTLDEDVSSQSIHVYAEDAGLDLLNTVCPAIKSKSAHTLAWWVDYFCDDNGWTINVDESEGSSLKLDLGEQTLTQRLLSLATEFDCELAYSFDIELLKITARHLNFYAHIGDDDAKNQYRINHEVSNISVNQSAENVATAYSVTGKDSLNLKGYSYTREINGDTYTVDTTTGQIRNVDAMERWSGILDEDGLMVRSYSYETDSQSELAKRASTALSKVCDGEVNYEVTFDELDAKIGDRIYIIDDAGEIYLESRVLAKVTSVCNNTVTATLGETLIQTSGISDRLLNLAETIQKEAASNTEIYIVCPDGNIFHNTAISTTLNAKVKYGDRMITTTSDLTDVFGSDASIVWSNNSTDIGTGFTLTYSSANTSEVVEVRLEV